LGNNSRKRVGISVRKERENSSPVVYLDSYYESYAAGEMSVEHVVKDIYNIFMNRQFPQIPEMELKEFEKIKRKVTYRLVNRQCNEELLKNAPYIPYYDLIIVFCLLPGKNDNSRMTVLIHMEHIKLWKADVQMLHGLAKENTPKLLPAVLRSIDEVMKAIAKNHLGDNYREDIIDDLLNTTTKSSLYVLSNTAGIYEVAIILYDGIFGEFSEKPGKDLLILPSSIHGTLLIPYEDGFGINELKERVRHINQAEIPEEDVLSDNVYCYRRKRDTISIAF